MKRKTEGCQFRANVSSRVAPDDIEKWHATKWKCGVECFGTAEADAYHSKVARSWVLAGEHFTIASSCAWDGSNLARRHANSV